MVKDQRQTCGKAGRGTQCQAFTFRASGSNQDSSAQLLSFTTKAYTIIELLSRRALTSRRRLCVPVESCRWPHGPPPPTLYAEGQRVLIACYLSTPSLESVRASFTTLAARTCARRRNTPHLSRRGRLYAMSHAGIEVDAIERSSSTSSLKRKRESPALSQSLHPPGEPSKSAKLSHGKRSPSASRSYDLHAAVGGATNHYRSPDSDDMHQIESVNTPRGAGSASSLTSTASSVFSHNSRAFAQNKTLAAANGLTPLTNHTDSSPAKGNSPESRERAANMALTNGTLVTSHVSTSSVTADPRESRPQMRPPPGKAKGYRVVWDPELDNKLSREERKRATPRRKEFGTEVCAIFHNLLSLFKMIKTNNGEKWKPLCTLSLTIG